MCSDTKLLGQMPFIHHQRFSSRAASCPVQFSYCDLNTLFVPLASSYSATLHVLTHPWTTSSPNWGQGTETAHQADRVTPGSGRLTLIWLQLNTGPWRPPDIDKRGARLYRNSNVPSPDKPRDDDDDDDDDNAKEACLY